MTVIPLVLAIIHRCFRYKRHIAAFRHAVWPARSHARMYNYILGAHQGGHATTRFLEGLLEGSLRELLRRRVLRRDLVRVSVRTGVLRRVLRRGGCQIEGA